MSFPLRHSTASQEIPLSRFVDVADADTAMTGLTIANTDIKLWKNAATAFVNKNSGGATHMADGCYYAVLDATDTDTLGFLQVYVKVATALYVKLDCIVYPAPIYDALIAGTDYLEAHPGKFSISGTAMTLYKRDGSTTQGSRTLGGTPGADPITSAS